MIEKITIVVLVVWNTALSVHIVLNRLAQKKEAKKLWKLRLLWNDEEGVTTRYVDPPMKERFPEDKPMTPDESFPSIDDSLAEWMQEGKRKKQAFDKNIDHKY